MLNLDQTIIDCTGLSEGTSELDSLTSSSPPTFTRLEETPYEKVCALRRQSVSPTSSLSSSPVNVSILHGRQSEQGPPRQKSGVVDMIPSTSIAVLDDASNDSGQIEGSEPSDYLLDESPHVFTEASSLADTVFTDDIADKDSSLSDYEVVSSCEEAGLSIIPSAEENISSSSHTIKRPRLPPPDELACGNPFLIFLCVAVLMQHRDSVMAKSLDANEIAMHFDRLVRRHNVERVLSQARTLYYKYLSHFPS